MEEKLSEMLAFRVTPSEKARAKKLAKSSNGKTADSGYSAHRVMPPATARTVKNYGREFPAIFFLATISATLKLTPCLVLL